MPQVFEREQDNAPHSPLFIQFDLNVRGFDLINSENRPDWRVIETAFDGFFTGASARMFPDDVAIWNR